MFLELTQLYLPLVVFLALLGKCSAFSPDLIQSLPGYFGQMSYNQYSGYLNGSDDGNVQLHYWFVESQNDPSSDPLVLWLNGGPGCSSMDGMLYEHGPLLVDDTGEKLTENPYAWNLYANMVYLESPACVGYSYSLNGHCTVSDDGASLQNFIALNHFLEKFPQYAGRDLYITGESYGGVYVPTLTLRIFQTPSPLQSMLKGFAVGNGLLSDNNNTNSLVTFAYTHGIISIDHYKNLLHYCNCPDTEIQCDFISGSPSNCQAELASALDAIYSPYLNIYDVIDTCYYGKAPSPGEIAKAQLTKEALFRPVTRNNKRLSRTLEKVLGGDPIVPCVNAVGATNYLNREDVRNALHIESSLGDWQICNTNFNYIRQYNDVVDPFHILVDNGIQSLVFNGDVDGACNFIGDQYFVDNLGYNATSSYDAWMTPDQQIGGWWQSYGPHLQFSTVRGAGHTVPEYKPAAALYMWKAFLQNRYV